MKKILAAIAVLIGLWSAPAKAVFYDLHVQGTWNPNTNDQRLQSGRGQYGDTYIVSQDGQFSLDSNSSWSKGDYITFGLNDQWNKLAGATADSMTVKPTGALNPTSLRTLFGDHPSVRMFGTANTSGHWNGDGINDDAPALNAAITYYCSLPAGGNIDIPNGTVAVASTVIQPCSNVHLQGKGTGSFSHDVGAFQIGYSTRLLWTGATGGTILYVGPSANLTTGTHNNNADVTGIFLDGNNIAGVGLDWRSTSGSEIHVTYHELTQIGVRIDTVPLAEFNDPQANEIWIEGSTVLSSGTGIRCDGLGSFPTSGNSGNCSLNQFRHIYLRILNGDGLVFGYSDHNQVDFFRAFQNPGGTGRALVFAAGPTLTFNGSPFTTAVSYNNRLDYVTTNAAIQAQGTESAANPSHDNYIGSLDRNNNTPFATIGTGATIKEHTDAGNWFGGNVSFGVNTDTPASTLDVNGDINTQFGLRINHTLTIDGANNAGFNTVTTANGVTPGRYNATAGLPSCSASFNSGVISSAYNLASTTHGTTAAGGGTGFALIFCDQVSWKVQ